MRWNPEISLNTFNIIEPAKIWVAQLIFLILANFIPSNLPKTLIFCVCILLDFRAISPHETRLYWPGVHQYAITKGSVKRNDLTGVANLWAGGGIGGVCSGNSGLGFFFTSRTFNISATACKIDRTWCCAIIKEILLRPHIAQITSFGSDPSDLILRFGLLIDKPAFGQIIRKDENSGDRTCALLSHNFFLP